MAESRTGIAGARTPEELETLFEDALLIRDGQAVAALFEAGAVLVAGHDADIRGDAIAETALTLWDGDHAYVANPQRVIQARDLALIVGERNINVARRSSDGAWRYAIVHIVSLTRTCTNVKENEMTQNTNETQTLKPVTVAKGEGTARWWFGSLAVIKATAADTGGQMSIIEITEAPGAEAPLHVHHREDEGFWILDGAVTFTVGDAVIEAHAGDYAFGPRGIPHRYVVGPDGCRMLFILTPGGFEEMVIEMSTPAKGLTLPPPPEEEPDWKWVAAVAKAHGNELLF